MLQRIAQMALLVRDYDEAISFYCGLLGFELVEDTRLSPEKRWVLVRPVGPGPGPCLLLARAANDEQRSRVGNQTGGRVFLFLHCNDFWKDYHDLKQKGIVFVREPVTESWGRVAVFSDLYGNLWDLIETPHEDQST